MDNFIKIDNAITKFYSNGDFKVYNKSSSDWLVFDWRQITWNKDGLNFLIEIYPNFDDSEIILSWNLYTAAYYEKNDNQYYQKIEIVSNGTLEYISDNINDLLETSFKKIIEIQREQIPQIQIIDY